MSKPIKSKATKSKHNKTTSRAATSGAPKTAVTRTTTKQHMILSLLRRKQGASLEEMKISGWQAHSVRGHLAGTVKTRLGLKLTSAKVNAGERRYFVAQV